MWRLLHEAALNVKHRNILTTCIVLVIELPRHYRNLVFNCKHNNGESSLLDNMSKHAVVNSLSLSSCVFHRQGLVMQGDLLSSQLKSLDGLEPQLSA